MLYSVLILLNLSSLLGKIW